MMRMSVIFIFFLGFLAFGGTVLSAGRQESNHGLSNTSKRVINGQIARLHEFPWQVSLRERKNNRHICGGTLISPYLVLTAAHCIVVNPCFTKYDVVLGAHMREGKTIFQQYRKVRRWYVHSSFSLDHFKKDIALLWLDRPVKINRAVHGIRLPVQGSRVPVGSYCVMPGWGRTRYNGKYSSTLRKTLLRIASHQSCAETNNILFEVDDKSMICAGGRIGRTGGCKGDSGGALACWEEGRWILRGVVSWGHEKCLTDYYTVFTRVSSLVNWIRYTARKG